MTDHALRKLRQDPHLAELAAFPFDFDLRRAAHGPIEPVRLASGGLLEVVAGGDTGSTYFVCADGSVLYADSEGSAGIIGSSIDEALEIVIGLPGWLDCVDLSPADGEHKILARIAEREEELRERYGIDEARAELRAALGLPERSPVALVALLHTALLRTEPDFLLLTEEGGPRTGCSTSTPGHRCGSRCSPKGARIWPCCGRATAPRGTRRPGIPYGVDSPCGPRSSTGRRATWSCSGICCGGRRSRP